MTDHNKQSQEIGFGAEICGRSVSLKQLGRITIYEKEKENAMMEERTQWNNCDLTNKMRNNVCFVVVTTLF